MRWSCGVWASGDGTHAPLIRECVWVYEWVACNRMGKLRAIRESGSVGTAAGRNSQKGASRDEVQEEGPIPVNDELRNTEQQQQQQQQHMAAGLLGRAVSFTGLEAEEEVKLATDVFELHSRGATHKLLTETLSGRQVSMILATWPVCIIVSLSLSIVTATQATRAGSISVQVAPGDTVEVDLLLGDVIGNLSFQLTAAWVFVGLFAALWLDLLYNWVQAPRRIHVLYQRLLLVVLPMTLVGVLPLRAISQKQFFEEHPFDGTLASLVNIIEAAGDIYTPLDIAGQVCYALLHATWIFYVLAKPCLLRSFARPTRRTYIVMATSCTLYGTALCLCTLCMGIATFTLPFCGWLRVVRALQLGIGSSLGQVSGFTFLWLVFLAAVELGFLVAVWVEIRKSERALRSAVYNLFRSEILALSFFKIGIGLTVFWSWVAVTIQFAPIDTSGVKGMLTSTGALFSDDLRFPGAALIFLAFDIVEVIVSYPASARRILLIIPLRRIVRPGQDLEWKARMSHDNSSGNLVVKSSDFVLEMQILLMNFAAFAYDFGVPGEEPRKVEALTAGKYRLIAHVSNARTDTHCIICEADDSIVVSFRGTKSAQNVKSDVNAAPIHLRRILDFDSDDVLFDAASVGDDCEVNREENAQQNVSRKVSEGLSRGFLLELGLTQYIGEGLSQVRSMYDHVTEKYCLAHSGFGVAYISVRRDVIVLVQLLLAKKKRPVLLTGHSLGGALATLFAYHLSKVCSEDIRENIVLVTCGSPRVGNYFFRQRFQERVQNAWRMCVEGDPVPRIPKLPFFHVGKLIILRIDGEIVADPSIVEEVHAARQPIKMAHHRMWVYRGIMQTFCELFTEPGFVAYMWDLGVWPDELRKAVRPSDEKKFNAQLLKLERILREHFELDLLIENFKADASQMVARNWRTLIQKLSADDNRAVARAF
ncbi:Lipase [Porphyridium purpureum]|uniref:Lipase n=1 Tax=Porphyridium purpureum TaxID=35688 RepID=A0A5J4Z9P9_PORPP|nr:Lipase [Porphyridium purpureum]|eukprot:POR6328..scf295_1